jgi:hypothetical protein
MPDCSAKNKRKEIWYIFKVLYSTTVQGGMFLETSCTPDMLPTVGNQCTKFYVYTLKMSKVTNSLNLHVTNIYYLEKYLEYSKV